MDLTQLASDLDGIMVACDINPVLVRKGSGEVRIVDAHCICTRQHSRALTDGRADGNHAG